jgi:hypothetical protein
MRPRQPGARFERLDRCCALPGARARGRKRPAGGTRPLGGWRAEEGADVARLWPRRLVKILDCRVQLRKLLLAPCLGEAVLHAGANLNGFVLALKKANCNFSLPLPLCALVWGIGSVGGQSMCMYLYVSLVMVVDAHSQSDNITRMVHMYHSHDHVLRPHDHDMHIHRHHRHRSRRAPSCALHRQHTHLHKI